MKENVLFEITKENLESGLRGIPVGYCVTSSVDPQKGLSYVGKPIDEFQDKDSLDAIYLLYYGKEGSSQEVAAFRDELIKRSQCHPELLKTIEKLPQGGHPMDAYAAAFFIAGMFESSGDYREDCLRVIAKLPEITATLINSQAGWGPTPRSKPELGYMENFVQMLKTPDPKRKELTEVMRIFHVLHLDHSGGNLSTFIGKAVASGLEPMWGSLGAAMGALAGPRHGKANQDCLEFVMQILKEVGESPKAGEVGALIRKKLENKELVFGFGHAVLRVEDPRATICYEYCKKHFADQPLVKVALALREEGSVVLKENPKISNPYPNVDAITGTMLHVAGFAYPEYYTILFGLSRAIGIAIQIVYERVEARGGKGTPIVRPKYLYKSRSSLIS